MSEILTKDQANKLHLAPCSKCGERLYELEDRYNVRCVVCGAGYFLDGVSQEDNEESAKPLDDTRFLTWFRSLDHETKLHFVGLFQDIAAQDTKPSLPTKPAQDKQDGLTHSDYVQLVGLALSNRAGWIPTAPFEAAMRKPLRSYTRANDVANLCKRGLIDCKPSKGGQTTSIRLTDLGKQTVIAMPDELPGEHFYPLPGDIAQAKAKLKSEDK